MLTRTEIPSGSLFLASVQTVRWWKGVTRGQVKANSIELTGNQDFSCFKLYS